MRPLDLFKEQWATDLKQSASTYNDDLPSYPSVEPDSLVSASRVVSFEIGTGASIYTQSLLPAILHARYEIILVTCFWAPSTTLNALRDTLQQLATVRAERARTLHPDHTTLPRLKIQICFSSRSLLQKLFHPRTGDGYIYPPSKWVSKLGLPDPQLLEAGLIDLRVKTLFFLPFSVMHPKYLIVDGQRAWLPSANVSWEPWLEGCIEVTGEIIAVLLKFYHEVWTRELITNGEPLGTGSLQQQGDNTLSPTKPDFASIQSPATNKITLQLDDVPTILLPSSHHRNPRFRPFPWQQSPSPLATPLNCAILRLLAMAEKNIYVQTPNLTSTAVIDALLEALRRGIDVTVVTSKGMMILEQVLTGGTITSWCLRAFVQRYKKLAKSSTHIIGSGENPNAIVDLEAGPSRLGSLEIFYFHPLSGSQQVPEEPVQSHLKFVTIDDEYAVLGSGNMDRASWFTSQELGILFYSDKLVSHVSNAVSQALRERVSCYFTSKH